jgi:hypothetical protein
VWDAATSIRARTPFRSALATILAEQAARNKWHVRMK